MATIYKCGICGKECKGMNGLMLHKMSAHPKEIQKSQTISEEPEDYYDEEEDLKLQQDPFSQAYWNRPHSDEEKRYDTYELNDKIHRLENIIKRQRLRPNNEDDEMDKMLNRFTKIAMIKQLIGGSSNEMFGQMMNFQKFIDGREPETQEDILSGLIKNIVPELIKKKSDVEKPSDILQTKEDDKKMLPTQTELLAMTDCEVIEILRPNMKMVKSLKLTKEQAYANLLNYYKDFPKDRFDIIWSRLFPLKVKK